MKVGRQKPILERWAEDDADGAAIGLVNGKPNVVKYNVKEAAKIRLDEMDRIERKQDRKNG